MKYAEVIGPSAPLRRTDPSTGEPRRAEYGRRHRVPSRMPSSRGGGPRPLHFVLYRGDHTRVGDGRRAALLARTWQQPASQSRRILNFLLVEKWENDRDLTGGWISEKLDGMRVWWDGTRFLSRQGNEFHAPPWFTAGLSKIPLVGTGFTDAQRERPPQVGNLLTFRYQELTDAGVSRFSSFVRPAAQSV